MAAALSLKGALHLEETGREEAIRVLEDLVEAREKIDSDTYTAVSKVFSP